MKTPNIQLFTRLQDITVEITQEKRNGGLEYGDASFRFKHVSGLSFLDEENIEIITY